MKTRTFILSSLKTTVLLSIFLLSSCDRNTGGDASGRTRIQINGSDTEVNLVQSLAEAYMEKNPDVSISVTGGGSGTGIASIINRQTDIANSSRPMSDSEIQQARSKGVEPVGIPFSIDGLAVIVNENIAVRELTLDQVSKIYKGEITNWRELGGNDLQITLYGRQSNSGTYVFFRDQVVKGEYSPRMRNMNGTAQIVEGVRSDRSGIGYVGIGYIIDGEGEQSTGINVLNIAKDENNPAVSPLERENVEKGTYPISRPLYQYVNAPDLENEAILDFIRFELSKEGQEVVARSGYYPIGEEYIQVNREIGIIK